MNWCVNGKGRLSLYESVLFSMLGGLMFVSKLLMEVLPNIHPLGMLTMAYTLTFRKKALIPIYIYVLLNGIYAGFDVWWVPYLYLWAILWGATMLLPKSMPKKAAMIVYPLVCAAHGAVFGILYAPAQALFFHMDFKTTLAWIVSGLPFDGMHTVGNFCVGLSVPPLSELLKRLNAKFSPPT